MIMLSWVAFSLVWTIAGGAYYVRVCTARQVDWAEAIALATVVMVPAFIVCDLLGAPGGNVVAQFFVVLGAMFVARWWGRRLVAA